MLRETTAHSPPEHAAPKHDSNQLMMEEAFTLMFATMFVCFVCYSCVALTLMPIHAFDQGPGLSGG